MADRSIHQLRNELNNVAVGFMALKRRLPADCRAEVDDTLRRIDAALERCIGLVASTPSAATGPESGAVHGGARSGG